MPTQKEELANVRAVRRERKKHIKMMVHGRGVKKLPARGVSKKYARKHGGI